MTFDEKLAEIEKRLSDSRVDHGIYYVQAEWLLTQLKLKSEALEVAKAEMKQCKMHLHALFEIQTIESGSQENEGGK